VVEEGARWIRTSKSSGKKRTDDAPGAPAGQRTRDEKEIVETSRHRQPSRLAKLGNLTKLLALGKNPSPTKGRGRRMA
jgi:hypothetical protein